MTELLSLSKVSKLLGVTTRSLRLWDQTGKIKTVRTAGGHRRIPMDEVLRLQRKAVGPKRKITLAYCRCSTSKQQENLERQVGRVLEYCSGKRWKTELYKDIGSGLNENRRQFNKLLVRITSPDVKRIVVEYKDRLLRFGFETFRKYCEGFGVEIVVIEDSEPKEFEQEFAEDIVALVASYSAKFYGRRGGKNRRQQQCAE